MLSAADTYLYSLPSAGNTERTNNDVSKEMDFIKHAALK